MKKFINVFLVLCAICILSVAALAADHTMSISTDKDVFEVGEKFNVSVVVTLTDDVELFATIGDTVKYTLTLPPSVTGTVLGVFITVYEPNGVSNEYNMIRKRRAG